MNQYLIELFENENTVIIPGFGALTMVNRASNELMFMSFMKHNDGTLENYIATKENIEKVDAKLKIDGFVDEINFALNNGNSFTIESIGQFFKDAAGDIQFNPITNVVENTDSPISSVVEVPVDVEPVKDEVIEAVASEEVIEPIVEEAIVENPIIETPIAVEEVEPIVEADTVVVEEIEEPIILEKPIVQDEIKIASEEEQWKDDLDLPPLNYKPDRPKKPILEKTKKDKKPRRGVGSLLLIVLALLIFGGATYVGINYNEIKQKIPFLASNEPSTFEKFKEKVGVSEEMEDLDEQIALEDEEYALEDEAQEIEETPEVKVAEQSTPEVVKSVQKPVEKPVVQVTTNGKFTVDKSLPIQIIVGSFSQEANANRMVDKLAAKGFPAAIVGTSGGLFTVSAASFNSMAEYNANISEIQKVGSYWVKK